MPSIDLWGHRVELVPDGYEVDAAARLADDLAFAAAALSRRLAVARRHARDAELLSNWLRSVAETEDVVPIAQPASPDPQELADLALGYQSVIDEELARMRKAGIPEKALLDLGTQALLKLKQALFSDAELDLEFRLPDLSARPAAASVVPAAPVVAPEPPQPVTAAAPEPGVEPKPEYGALTADAPATPDQPTPLAPPAAPAAVDVTPAAPAVLAAPSGGMTEAGEHFGQIHLEITPLETMSQLRQAQEVLAQFSDVLTVTHVEPRDDIKGATFVADLSLTAPLLRRLNRIAGVTAEPSGPATIRITLGALPEAAVSSAASFVNTKLGGVMARPHGPAARDYDAPA